MRSFVVAFRITRVVEAETPEEAQQWADWTFTGLRAMMPGEGPHHLGVVVLGPAGPDHIQVIEERETPLEDEGETKEPKR